jgi:hypothetical protein
MLGGRPITNHQSPPCWNRALVSLYFWSCHFIVTLLLWSLWQYFVSLYLFIVDYTQNLPTTEKKKKYSKMEFIGNSGLRPW